MNKCPRNSKTLSIQQKLNSKHYLHHEKKKIGLFLSFWQKTHHVFNPQFEIYQNIRHI
jgi:hypothetical protein